MDSAFDGTNSMMISATGRQILSRLARLAARRGFPFRLGCKTSLGQGGSVGLWSARQSSGGTR